jgi:hypothetical protein
VIPRFFWTSRWFSLDSLDSLDSDTFIEKHYRKNPLGCKKLYKWNGDKRPSASASRESRENHLEVQ